MCAHIQEAGRHARRPRQAKMDKCDCRKALQDTLRHWTDVMELKENVLYMPRVRTNIKLGDRVIVYGKYTGIVKYIGDLDSYYGTNKIYAGIKIDDPGVV